MNPKNRMIFIKLFMIFMIFAIVDLMGTRLVQAESSSRETLISRLLGEARYWADLQRYDRAEKIWKRILLSDPTNAISLTQLGVLSARSGRKKEAKKYLKILNNAHPDDPGVKKIREAIQLGVPDKSILSQARKAVRSGNLLRALDLYRTYFHGTDPDGKVGLEYYLTMSNVKQGQGWEKSVAGLQVLAFRHHFESQYLFDYAKVLTYRENTRWAGLNIMAKMISQPRNININEVSIKKNKILEAWRNALLWAAPIPIYDHFFHDYLNVEPNDMKVLSRWDTQKGYQLIKRNDLISARSEFLKSVTLNKKNGDGWGGLGIIFLRQRNYTEANKYFLTASIFSSSPEQWKMMSQQTRYQSLLEKSRNLLAHGKYHEARRWLVKAIRLEPNEYSGQYLLANLLEKEGKIHEAQKIYRSIYSQDSSQKVALLKMVNYLLSRNHLKKAIALLRHAHVNNTQPISRILLYEAKNAEKENQTSRALGLLTNASVLNPQDPWIIFEKAKILNQEGKKTTIIEEPLQHFEAIHPGNPDAHLALATLYSIEGKPFLGIVELKKIPRSHWTPTIAKLDRILQSDAKIHGSYRFAKDGQVLKARQFLEEGYRLRYGSSYKERGDFWDNQATLDYEAGNYSLAFTDEMHSVNLDRENRSYRKNAIGYAWKMQNPEIVKQLAEQGMNLFPEDPEFYMQAGLAEWSTGDTDKALDDLVHSKWLAQKMSPSHKKWDFIALIDRKIKKIETQISQNQNDQSRFEAMGGETIFSQYTQYYFAELGELVPFSGSSVQSGRSTDIHYYWHFFFVPNYFTFQIAGSGNGIAHSSESYMGVNPATGLRILGPWGYWEGDLGLSWAQFYQPLVPIREVYGIYAQSELFYRLGFGNLDLLGTFTGYINYLFLQARFFHPVYQSKGDGITLSLGPEFIGQGNNEYNAQQGGMVLSLHLPFLSSTISLDGGGLHSSVYPGIGEYEGMTWYFSF